MPYRASRLVVLSVVCWIPFAISQPRRPDDFRSWHLEKAVSLLSQSPWARQETYTRVVGGIGSGVSGEKEIYSTFFIRFLSARPIREAYARVRQIQAKYDQLTPEEKLKLEHSLAPGLGLDVSRWIVVAVAFRSNDPTVELRVKQFFQVQSTETMRPRAFLAVLNHAQVPLAAYFPPLEEEVGAKFVFPRRVNGAPVVSKEIVTVSFELDVPGFEPDLRTSFPVAGMVVNGEPIL